MGNATFEKWATLHEILTATRRHFEASWWIKYWLVLFCKLLFTRISLGRTNLHFLRDESDLLVCEHKCCFLIGAEHEVLANCCKKSSCIKTRNRSKTGNLKTCLQIPQLHISQTSHRTDVINLAPSTCNDSPTDPRGTAINCFQDENNPIFIINILPSNRAMPILVSLQVRFTYFSSASGFSVRSTAKEWFYSWGGDENLVLSWFFWLVEENQKNFNTRYLFYSSLSD